LQKNVTGVRRNKLRDEGQEEKRGLGIEGLSKDALVECVSRWRCGRHGQLGVARADHANSQPDEISGSGVFHGVEGDRGGRENRGNAERGGKYVKQSADECAQRRKNSFAAAPGQAARQNVENSRARCDCQQQCGGDKKQEAMRVKHPRIVRVMPRVQQGAPARLYRIDAVGVFGLA